ncbi:MAG: DUF4270 domain-containing protein [Prevotellaceae bacterium]|jgi:hypothetical protein|nr:DUF4270 domain-containing protein [Prevotellaceae bacterium]
MTRFLQKSKLAIPLFAALHLLLAQACTEVNKTLGEDFVPPNQKLKVEVRDASGFFTMKNITLDSTMSTSSFSTAMLGRLDDARLGKTAAGFAAQFLPASYTFEFEAGVTGFDSVFLILGFSSTYGSDNTPMTVEVYELNSDISIDSTYYGKPEVAESVSKMDVNLAENSGSSVTDKSTSVRVRLDTAAQLFSKSLSNRLLNHTSSADSFLTYFKGLYVKVKDNEGGGCVKSVSLVNSTSSYASSAIVAYYTYDSDGDGVKDSVTSFSYHVFNYTPRFNVFKHENSNLLSDNSMLYMQGLVGVATQLTINPDSVKAWTGVGDAKKNYAISRAELVLHVQDTSDYDKLNSYATQLQCIVEASSSTSGKYAAIRDMYASDGSFSSAFGGAINRSLMQYSLNVTLYFNNAVKGGATSPMIIIPYGYTSDASSVLINNTSKKPQLKITYVEIKE